MGYFLKVNDMSKKRSKLIHLSDDDFKVLTIYCLNVNIPLKHYIEKLCVDAANDIRRFNPHWGNEIKKSK